MPKYIKKKALKNAIECCTWYHINPKGELTTGAYGEEDALVKYSDIKKIIKGLPTRKFEDEPQTCSFSDCDNFKNPDYARCIECKRKQIKSKDEPQTDCSWK